jgi:hypothetical protein
LTIVIESNTSQQFTGCSQSQNIATEAKTSWLNNAVSDANASTNSDLLVYGHVGSKLSKTLFARAALMHPDFSNSRNVSSALVSGRLSMPVCGVPSVKGSACVPHALNFDMMQRKYIDPAVRLPQHQ